MAITPAKGDGRLYQIFAEGHHPFGPYPWSDRALTVYEFLRSHHRNPTITAWEQLNAEVTV